MFASSWLEHERALPNGTSRIVANSISWWLLWTTTHEIELVFQFSACRVFECSMIWDLSPISHQGAIPICISPGVFRPQAQTQTFPLANLVGNDLRVESLAQPSAYGRNRFRGETRNDSSTSGGMMSRDRTILRQDVLDAICEHPRISLRELYSALAGSARSRIEDVVGDLLNSGAVEWCGPALLRITETERASMGRSPRYEASGFIQPPSRDRLMSGR